MYIENLIEKKWKLNKINNRGKLYCLMPKISDDFYLHELCEKIDTKYYEAFEEHFGIKLLPELKEFYKCYNGCRLFISSVNIYGLPKDNSFPMDLAVNNFNMRSHYKLTKEEKDDIVFFGSVGDLDLWYKQSEIKTPKIYLTEKGNIKPLKVCGSIEEIIRYYFDILYDEYGEDGYRKHPDVAFDGIPSLANKFFGEIDW